MEVAFSIYSIFKFITHIDEIPAFAGIEIAKIAQLVERHLAKVEVAGSNPVFRSGLSAIGGFFFPCSSGGIGRHAGLKILWASARAGSSPASSTKPKQLNISVLAFLFYNKSQNIFLYNG